MRDLMAALAVCGLALGGAVCPAAEPAAAPARLPEGAAGIAAKFPGDAAIDKDPRVLLHEDFESGALDKIRWSEISNKAEALSFSDDVPAASAGRKSLLVTARLGANTGGHLFRRFKPGVERMHARFYVKFAPDCDYVHHFVHIVAENPPTPWPTGGAGECPPGDKKFCTGLEPCGFNGRQPPPGAWNFYSYWWKMKRSGDGKYWGNSFAPAAPAVPERGRWYAMEMMVQANTVGQADGRQAFWIDGRLVGDFGGIEWRTAADLKVNAFWLMSYITDRWTKHPVNRVGFDDVVVATDYIGPIAPKK
ncbi:MAG: hypothetical protein FJ288_05765 [Planctomycetes bacterium]|nr:hypothetical protein [Planctomycetota bacterium]